jgi:hypothetical protein
MRYRDISTDRFRLPPSHPYLAEIVIDPVDWFRLERLEADTPATRILGYDEPRDGRMTIYVACSSREVQDRLEDGWS